MVSKIFLATVLGRVPAFLVGFGVSRGSTVQVRLLVGGQCELNKRSIFNGHLDALVGRYNCGDVVFDRAAGNGA